MPRFTDADGEKWQIDLSTVEIKRVRDELEVDLLDVGNKQLFARFLNDPVLIVDVLHVVLREEAEQRSLDAVGFARRLRGDVLDEATQAFLEAYIAFFPKRRRAAMQAALTKSGELADRQSDHALQVLQGDKIDRLLEAEMAKIDLEIDRQLAEISGAALSSGPPSPASDRATESP